MHIITLRNGAGGYNLHGDGNIADNSLHNVTLELLHQNNDVSAELRLMHEILKEKDKRIEDLQKAMLMLADKTPKKRWFQF